MLDDAVQYTPAYWMMITQCAAGAIMSLDDSQGSTPFLNDDALSNRVTLAIVVEESGPLLG